MTGPLTTRLIKRGGLDGMLPSAISNTGATASSDLTGNPFIKTGQKSNKIFHLPYVSPAQASDIRLLWNPLCHPACTVDMVPSLCGAYLFSTSNLTNTGYVSIYDDEEVNIYGGRTAKIAVSAAAVLQGWRCCRNKL